MKLNFILYVLMVSTLWAGGKKSGIAIKGQYAYVLDGRKNFFVYSIANPLEPVLTDSIRLNENATNIKLWNNIAVVAGGAQFSKTKIQFLDLSNPSTPNLMSKDINDSAIVVEIKNNRLYALDNKGKILAIRPMWTLSQKVK